MITPVTETLYDVIDVSIDSLGMRIREPRCNFVFLTFTLLFLLLILIHVQYLRGKNQPKLFITVELTSL